VSCRSACYSKVRNVRVRGVPEMAICLVFTPDDPEIYTLNPSAWLILQLCDGRSEREIAHAYLAAVEPAMSPEEVICEVRVGIERLLKRRIIAEVRGKHSKPVKSGRANREPCHGQKYRTASRRRAS
jgi:hypothetical protein